MLLCVVSIFLYSCGIPTFCTLENISFTSSNLGFTLNGIEQDLSKVEKGPGVIICYVVGDSEIPDPDLINTTGLIKHFKEITDLNKLNIANDNSITKFTTYQGNEYTLYAFNNISNQIIYRCSNPVYNIDLKSNGYINNNSISETFSFNDIIWNVNDLNIKVKDSSNNIVQNLYADLTNENGSYVYLYVAFSAEVGNFSNNYWSKLLYIGSIAK